MREWLRQRPWVWVVALFLFFVTANVILAVIAVLHQPERIPLGG